MIQNLPSKQIKDIKLKNGRSIIKKTEGKFYGVCNLSYLYKYLPEKSTRTFLWI